MILHRDVAPGVHRVEDGFVNWYLVEGDAGLTAVDAGVPDSWASLAEALRALGRTPGDLRAIVLTHGHFDHVGFAPRAHRDLHVPVWVPAGDVEIAARPAVYPHERSPLWYAWRPATALILLSLARQGALWRRGIADVLTYADGDELPVPGAPVAIATPGHSPGHRSLLLRGRDTLLAGDALVTLDAYTGRRGPRLVARAATADSDQARRSLQRIGELEAGVLLPGHGDPWRHGAAAAAELALAAEQG